MLTPVMPGLTPVLFLLTRLPETGPPQDQTHSVLVRAVSRLQARELASTKAGDEGPEAWLDEKRTFIERVELDGPVEIIHVGTR